MYPIYDLHVIGDIVSEHFRFREHFTRSLKAHMQLWCGVRTFATELITKRVRPSICTRGAPVACMHGLGAAQTHR